MNGLAKQRGSRFFVAERHHNHSDVTVGTFYEEKKPTIWLQYLFDLNKTQRCKAFRGFFVSIFLFFLLFFYFEGQSCHGSELSCFLTHDSPIKQTVDKVEYRRHPLHGARTLCHDNSAY